MCVCVCVCVCMFMVSTFGTTFLSNWSRMTAYDNYLENVEPSLEPTFVCSIN